MSYNHENVVWQSPDGTWARGFYAVDYLTCGGNEDACGDETHEWCREFDQNRFQWVSAGHPTADAAYRSWNGSNPGGSSEVSGDYATAEEIARLEDMAAVLCEEEEERQATRRRDHSWGYSSRSAYNGPPKRRTLVAIKRQHDQHIEEHVGHRLGGYDNMLDPQVDALKAKIAERLKTAAPAEIDAYEQADAEHRDALRKRLADHKERRREQARQNSRFGMYGGYRPGALDRSRKITEREDETEALIASLDKAAAERAEARKPKKKAAPAVPKTAPAKKPAPKTAAKAPAKKGPAKRTTAPTAAHKRGVTPGLPTNSGSFKATEKAEAAVTLAPQPAPAADWSSQEDPWA